MPRNYKKQLGSRAYKNYSEETLQNALQAIQGGLGIREASRRYGIEPSTLSRKRRNLFPRNPGRQPVFSKEEENALVNNILLAAQWGFPLTAYDIRLIVKQYLDRKGIKEKRFGKDNMPGSDWARYFLNRHKSKLSARLCENIKRSRAEVSKEIINDYFSELEKSLENVPPQNIINYDETNFSDDPGRQKVIVKRGARHSERYMDSSKTSVSVMISGSAAGHILPPYVVYKAQHLYDTWTQNGVKDSKYNRSKSGWFDLTIFEDWFFQIALQYFRNKDGPKVMLGDNLSSHLSDRVITACREHNISFILLPPNSTHLCQPLDVAFFKPVKSAWRDVLLHWKQKNKGCIPKDQFPRLLKNTLEKVKSENLVAGFKATGIYPLNRDEVLKRLPDWSQHPPVNEDALHNSFADLLRQTRFPNDNNKQVKRKKRLNVVAGKSVSYDTLAEDHDLSFGDDVNDETTNPKPSTSQETSDTSLSDNHMSVHDSDSDQGEEYNQELSNYNEGDYILVEFAPQTKIHQAVMYVGQVQEVLYDKSDTLLYCKFLRTIVEYMLSPVPLTLFSLLVVISTAVILLYKQYFSYWKKRGLNYLEPTIPFGNATNIYLGKSSFGEIFSEWYLEMKKRGWKHGGAYFFGKPVYMAIENDLIKKIIVTDFIHFPNHGFYIDEKVDPFSGHVFNMENYKWKNLRAKLPAAFTAAKMRTNVVIMEKISKILVQKLDEYAINKKSINIKDVLSRFATDIITSCAFGMQSNTLNDENETLMKEGRVFFDYQWSRTNNTIVLLIPRQILGMLNFKIFTKSATKYFMNMFREIKEHREKENVKRNDLTDLLMDLCDQTRYHPDFNGKGQMDPLTFEEFAAQMYVFFEAGFETSSSTQTFAMYELGANPEIQDRLRDEINKVLEKHNGQVTYDSVNEMIYLDRLVDETLRKYPVFPVLPRACTKDYKVPDTDFTIEEGTFVMVTNLGIQYDPEYYPDPMKFDPDRFLPENKAKRPYCSYMPFGEGPRICVGKRFGLWQTKIGLVSMVRSYKITLSKKMQLPFNFDKSGLILKTKGDVWVDLKKI